jgi:hypothetical protein
MSADQAVVDLERAVQALTLVDPGELEALLPRLAKADFEIINLRHSTRELCNAERARRAAQRLESMFKELA